jgi:O-antigen/teichoic acid export membrane protein
MSIRSARSALAWAGGVQAFQDLAQFGAMLVLVRLLSPSEYGAMALAQAILAVVTLFGPGTFVGHALQSREPASVDWQSHYTASLAVSCLLALALLVLAGAVALPIWGKDVGLALAVLTSAVLLGGPAHVRNTYLHAHHDWARYRLLSLAGTCLGLGVGIALGFAGYGVIALAVQPAFYVLPSAIDQVLFGFKPDWRFDRAYYRDVIGFGVNRFAAGAVFAARGFAEQSSIATHFSLAGNGVYGRSVGLSNLLAGRIGAIALAALYPILTRAETGSAQFRRNSARVLQGVAWIAIPAATFIAIEARAIVALLYGEAWMEVARLLPAAAAVAAIGALQLSVSRLLLANESRRASLAIDGCSGLVSIGLAIWLLPNGLNGYLWALASVGAGAFACGALLLVRARALDLSGIAVALAPALIAAGLAALLLRMVAPHVAPLWLPLGVVAAAACFALVHIAVLLVGFTRPTSELLTIVPGFARFNATNSPP